MSGQIIVYNKKTESHQLDKNNFYIGRGENSVLGNPFSHIKDKETLAKYIVDSRDEAISKYEELLPVLYIENPLVNAFIDTIYHLYKNGETVYLECYCHPLKCHGDIIKEFILKMDFREKFLKRMGSLFSKNK
jgi:hypothetical protein